MPKQWHFLNYYFDFWEFIFYLKISNFNFLWNKYFSGKLHQNSRKKCWQTVQKSKKRKAVQVYFIISLGGCQRYMYGRIFKVNGFTSACSSKSTWSSIIYIISILANKNNPKTEVSNNLSGVKNITHETRQSLKWPARNPLSLVKEKKNEHLCLTCRTSFRLKYLLHA